MGMDKNKTIMIGIIAISIFFILILISSVSNDEPDPIYLLHIPRNISNILIVVFWPYFGSLIFVILFPRIFTPLYFNVKKLQMKGYTNAFVKMEQPDLNVRKIFKRSFSVSLLSVGLSVTLIGFGIINPIWLTSEPMYQRYLASGTNINYTIEAILLVPLLLYPIIVGLYSIGWSIEDCGIMHYNIPDDDSNKYFEIEPVYYRYNDVLSGYAGFSAIIFILGAVYYYLLRLDISAGFNNDSVITFSLILSSILLLMIPMLLSYLLYWKHDKSYLIKNLKQIRRISREDLELMLESK